MIMKNLEELAASLTEIAQLPEAVQKARQEQFGNIQTLGATIEAQGRKVALIEKRQGENHAAAMEMVKNLITQEFKEFTKAATDSHQFLIDAERPDESLEQAIKRGQEIQQPFWEEGEEKFTKEFGNSPAGPGWYGSTHMPVITLLFSGSEYRFHNTIRIPGRFQMRSVARWGPAIRTLGDGGKVLKVDSIFGYNPCVGHPIGVYTEPATLLQSGMIVRPFEQDIRDNMIVAHNNCVPVYLAQNPDRLQIINNNIQAYQGSNIGIFHGPHIDADWMPKAARPKDDVYLGDSAINNNQIEGPHRMIHNGSRKQAGIFYSGQAVQTNFNRFFGYSHCIYAHGGRARISMGNQAYAKPTADGRAWAKMDQLVGTLFCGFDGDMIASNTGVGFHDNHVPKSSRIGQNAGWHNAGEVSL